MLRILFFNGDEAINLFRPLYDCDGLILSSISSYTYLKKSFCG